MRTKQRLLLYFFLAFFSMQVFSQNACDDFVHSFSVYQEICNSRVISFKNLNAAATSVDWDFGDGKTGSGMEISHEYSSNGDYQVKMKVGYNNGCSGEVIKNVAVFFTLKNDLISSVDQTICPGEKIQLNANTNNAEFCWVAAEGLTDQMQKNPVVQPTNTTTYRFQTRFKGENLITNSGFEQGNVGFTSEYIYKKITDYSESQYAIVTNPFAWHFGFEACSDHTLGFGNMMVVNGASIPNSVVWSQTVQVNPNTTYELALWISSVNKATPAKLRFKINGKIIGDEVNAGENACDWNQFSTYWNSENESTAEIVIINVNTAASGNDFALDDISFFEHNIFYDEVTIKVNPAYQIQAGEDVTICEGQSIQLNGKSDVSASTRWTPVNGLSDPTAQNPIASPDKTTNYVLTVISPEGCEAKDSVIVSVDMKPVISMNNDIIACVGESITLNALSPGATNYKWYPENGLSNPNISSPVAKVNTTTTYSVTVTNSFGCENTEKVILTAVPLPLVNILKPNDIDCSHSEVQLSASGGAIYHWRSTEDMAGMNASSIIVKPTVSTIYTVKAVSYDGCEATASVTVNVKTFPVQNLFIPSAFTPNGDGRNDCFGLRTINITYPFQFEVFNRLGQKVFATSNTNNCWDGTFKGIPQPADAFVWQIKVRSECGDIYKKGTVVLIR